MLQALKTETTMITTDAELDLDEFDENLAIEIPMDLDVEVGSGMQKAS